MSRMLYASGSCLLARKPVYTPHLLRVTAATLLLDSGVDIMQVKELLGHRHATTTQIYDKRRHRAKALRTKCRCKKLTVQRQLGESGV
jgi:site-specific recombinase XerD